jgi:hypothetical protein
VGALIRFFWRRNAPVYQAHLEPSITTKPRYRCQGRWASDWSWPCGEAAETMTSDACGVSVRVRGIPYKAKEADILAFFPGLAVEGEVRLLFKERRTTGEVRETRHL